MVAHVRITNIRVRLQVLLSLGTLLFGMSSSVWADGRIYPLGSTAPECPQPNQSNNAVVRLRVNLRQVIGAINPSSYVAQRMKARAVTKARLEAKTKREEEAKTQLQTIAQLAAKEKMTKELVEEETRAEFARLYCGGVCKKKEMPKIEEIYNLLKNNYQDFTQFGCDEEKLKSLKLESLKILCSRNEVILGSKEIGKGGYKVVSAGISYSIDPRGYPSVSVNAFALTKQKWKNEVAKEMKIYSLINDVARRPKSGLLWAREIKIGDEPVLEQDYYNGGDLTEASSKLSSKALIDVLYQVSTGLTHLHEMRIVHRDIKGPNILLKKDGTGGITAGISDFGLAIEKKGEEGLSNGYRGGTIGYVPPEVLRKEGSAAQDFKQDVYALGVTIAGTIWGTIWNFDLGYLRIPLSARKYLSEHPDHELSLKDYCENFENFVKAEHPSKNPGPVSKNSEPVSNCDWDQAAKSLHEDFEEFKMDKCKFFMTTEGLAKCKLATAAAQCLNPDPEKRPNADQIKQYLDPNHSYEWDLPSDPNKENE